MRWACKQRRLSVVEAALGHQRDQIVGIEIDGVGVGRRNIVTEPPPHQPRPGAQKILAGDSGKRLSEPRVVDACGGKYLLGICGPDDTELGLRVHFALNSRPCYYACVL